MTELEFRDQAFEAIVNGDIAPLLIHADWMEENGQPELAAIYRLWADPDNETYIDDFNRLTGGYFKTWRQTQKQLDWINRMDLPKPELWDQRNFGGFRQGMLCNTSSLSDCNSR